LQTIARRPKSGASDGYACPDRTFLVGKGWVTRRLLENCTSPALTVGKWRERFRKDGMDGLVDEPRVGAPDKITDPQIAEVVTKTLESIPANGTHWSTKLIAAETGLSQNALVRIWHVFGLQPYRVENFKFSQDPQFVEKGAGHRGLVPKRVAVRLWQRV
jgi:transposase